MKLLLEMGKKEVVVIYVREEGLEYPRNVEGGRKIQRPRLEGKLLGKQTAWDKEPE